MPSPTIPCLLFILLVVSIIGQLVYSHIRVKNGKGLKDEVAPVIERYATVMEKYPEERWGNSKTPDYNVRYMVKFKDDNGVITSVSVPPEIYEDIPVGMRDLLITQSDTFYDFGGRYGQNIPKDEQNQ